MRLKHVLVLLLIVFEQTFTADDWWKNAVFYQIYPRSFKDSNNDGVGDLMGIVSKLSHLKDAGVTAAWLSPIYKSPQIDQGYDISDYMSIDPIFGNMTDFELLISSARDLGIKIIMDFVPNHSSDQHEWFIASQTNDTKYRDYYVWAGEIENILPNNWLSVFSNSSWTYSDTRKQFYLHHFTKEQPDLNLRNPNVVAELTNVLKFWLDKGVDGFRMDAVPFLFEDVLLRNEPLSDTTTNANSYDYLNHIYTNNLEETYDLIYQWRKFLDEYTALKGGDARVIMTEAYADLPNTMKYYGNDCQNGAHFTFNFQLISQVTNTSTAYHFVETIQEWLINIPNQFTSNWVLGNHDNSRVATRFGPKNVDGFNMLIALLPGVMVTYNGEEIGQENGEVTWEEGQDPNACHGSESDFNKVSRDFERTPFQWDNTTNAGFNNGTEPWLPVSNKFTETNLMAQSVPGVKSHYHVYQDLIALRKEEVFKSGNVILKALSSNVIAFTRALRDGTVYVVVINISNEDEIVDLRALTGIYQRVKIVLTSVDSSKDDRILPTENLALAPHEAIVGRVLKDGDKNWWKHAVFYQIYPRSFKDDTNDGIGDLKGIISKFDHLFDAGVNAAWLSPIYESPQVDQGYDISNFIQIDEDYGSLDDLKDLIRKAHDLGIKIIMDFVPNHSSDQHEWFQLSRNRTAPYEDYYVWKDGVNGTPPNNWISIFKNSAWEFCPIRQQYYLHQFAKEQPDLNYENSLVVQEMKDVLKFWLDVGVDGFRMDAVPYLFEDDQFLDEPPSGANVSSNDHNYLIHTYTSDQQKTFEMIYEWRQFLDNYTAEYGGDDRIMMTEAYTDIKNTMKYYGDGDKLGAHFTFNFQLITQLSNTSTATDIVNTIDEWLDNLPSQYTSNWVLGNHDNPRVATKFGPQNVDGFNMLTAFLPGVMVTYNGEEIGQENGEVTWEEGKDPNACTGNETDFDRVSRDFERTPFQWDNSTNAGFNNGHETWLPVSSKYRETNLKAQSVPGIRSHYHVYQEILKLRQQEPFVTGNVNILALSENVVAYTRNTDDETTSLVVINISDQEETVNLTALPGVNQNVRIVSASVNSAKYDRVLPTNSFTLAPHEAITAKVLPEVVYGSKDWWKHAVFYQIYPRSFKDDTNDGIGDLQGIISKLNHLTDAGVNAAWLSPIYESPQVDQGYDISNFLQIDEDYGSMDDFKNLIQKAHDLGIKIIMDFVPNHSSDQHEWFQLSRNRTAPYEDYYVWRDGVNGTPPNNWISVFKNSAWELCPIRQQYYLHQFAKEQPDLNYENPLVVQEMKNVLKFWLDLGVDGFRMDAVPHIFEDDQFLDEPPSGANVPSNEHPYLSHIYTTDQPKTFEMIYEWRQFLDDYTREHGGDDRIMMTEAYSTMANTMKYYGDGDKLGAHFTFNFQFITKLSNTSTAADIVNATKEWLDNIPSQYTSNWVLGNHDNTRVATKFGPENVDGFNMLTAFLPGVMVTYNGEEIGQENGEVTWDEGHDPSACNGNETDFDRVSRDFERTPFQWDNSTNAGFNDGHETWLPVSSKYLETNLKAQSVPGIRSHYHVYQELLKLRQQEPFVTGNVNILALSENVVAYTRNTDDGTTSLVVINISDQEEIVNLTSLPGVNQNVRIVSASVNSAKYDRVLPTNPFTLAPHEAITAKALPDVVYGSKDWWKHAVFYQIYPRSFKDDNNDGIGDLKGIISKFDHLADAGVNASWLSPIYESPQVDQGYDISNFLQIDEDYGSIDDLKDLIKKAHELGIKMIMDFVPNHSSDQHEWFQLSRNRTAPYEDYYVWKDGVNGGPPNNWLSLFKYSAWKHCPIRDQYYLHQFSEEQPDLNYENPLVVQEMKDVLKFWLDLGIDGFRMDAVPYIFEDDRFLDEPLSNANVSEDDYKYLFHNYTSDQPKTFQMIYAWRQYLDDYTREHGGDDRIMMTEAYTDINNTMKYYGDGNQEGAHFSFNFQLITRLSNTSTATDIVNTIDEWLENLPSQYTSNWVLGNHDNPRVATKFGPQNVDGFNMLTAFLPGVMVTYNGEEIGQENGEVTWEEGKDPSACNGNETDFDMVSRDFERTPFQWDNSTNAGFNDGNETWLPVSIKYLETNLKAQSVPGIRSHYHVYQEILKLRQEEPFVTGNLTLLTLSDNVVAYTRATENDTMHLIVINISDQEETVNLTAVPGVNQNIRVVSASVNSSKYDRVLPTNPFTLAPHEAITAKALPVVVYGSKDWWKHAVFYQIYPRSFKDDNNDGIGDLKGIISKLEHLKDAGVNAAWLSPIYESPQVDQGYDISNFTAIDADYGTFEDFQEFVEKAHALGIKVIMDFVPNHSSNQHIWFEKSRNRESPYEDYYVWRDPNNGSVPNNWISNFKYSAWAYCSKRNQYYLHQFAIQQPDLNYRNPLVVQEMKDVLKFWLDLGVDGFRMDAVPYIFEDSQFLDEPRSDQDVSEDDYKYLEHIYTSDQPETFDIIYEWRRFLDEYTSQHGGDDRVIMTEAYTDIENTMKYYGSGSELGAHFTFNFQLITKVDGTSTAANFESAINEWLTNIPTGYVSNWVLGNHDNHRVATRFGPENVDGFNMLIAFLPGVMVTYNAEEIGQENGEVSWEQGEDPNACNSPESDFEKNSRDFERTPFQWDGTINAGFNDGHETWLPVSSKYIETNLELQIGTTNSHYQIYKQILELRQETVFLEGNVTVTSQSDNTIGVVRAYANETWVLLFNIGNSSNTVDLTPGTNFEIALTSGNSQQNIGDVLDATSISLQAHESILGVLSGAVSAYISICVIIPLILILIYNN